MSNKKLAILTLIIVGIAVVIFFFSGDNRQADRKLDVFAKCLANKGITMYGADWCPHCQNEKRAFGDSFEFVPYIECPQNLQKCLTMGINGYPTWIFPASSTDGPDNSIGSEIIGKKFEGEQGLKKLSQESGCPLPVTK